MDGSARRPVSSARPPEIPGGGDPRGVDGSSQIPGGAPRGLGDGSQIPGGANDVPGEERATIDGVTFRRGAKLVLRPGVDRDLYDRMLDGRVATLERIYLDYDDRVYLGVTVDDDPGQALMRETGRYLFFFAHEVRLAAREVGQILVAGIGNAWLQDDGFGGEVARRLQQHELPAGVTVLDAGTGGLDLAYEVMRGYEALVLLDISRQGGEPGSLYVIEPDPEDVGGQLADGEAIDPHAMDPRTVLRFVKLVGGWPGKVVVIACEPGEVGDVGLGLTPAVQDAVERATELVLETLARLRTAAAER